MKSFVSNNIRRWLILARGKFSPPLTEGANRVMRRVFFSLPLRYVPSLWNLLLFPLILLAVPACKQPTAPDPKPEFSFTIEDASCTEAWLNVKTANFGSGFSFALNRNDSTIWRFAALPPDTIIVDEGLLPNKEYTYELLAISSKTAPVSAGKKKVTTMDTTSHNFTWQTWEFGDIGSSVLYDVAIIDENNIWAVGEISIRDSSHNGYTTYNAVHWDGVKWELIQIPFYYQGALFYLPLKSVFAFAHNDIWFEAGLHWNGSKYEQIPVNISFPSNVNKLWGTSSRDLYAVGNSGNIAHFDGVSWKKIESGTTTNINDIWGITDKSGESRVYCAVTNVFEPGDWKILKIINTRIDSLKWNTGRRVHSVWTVGKNYLYASGGGIYENKSGYWREQTEVPLYYSRNVRGTGNNNIFVCGDHCLLAHYNGTSWKTYAGFLTSGIYFALSVKERIVVTVGLQNGRAGIVMGKRY